MITKWKHPGGKLREEGAASLTDSELLAILISTGIKGKPAERIAEEVLERFGSLILLSQAWCGLGPNYRQIQCKTTLRVHIPSWRLLMTERPSSGEGPKRR